MADTAGYSYGSRWSGHNAIARDIHDFLVARTQSPQTRSGYKPPAIGASELNAPAFRTALQARVEAEPREMQGPPVAPRPAPPAPPLSADRERMMSALSLFPRDLPPEVDDPQLLREDEVAAAQRRAAAAQQRAQDYRAQSRKTTSVARTRPDMAHLADLAGQQQAQADVQQLTADALTAIFGAPPTKTAKAAPAKSAKAAPAKTTAPKATPPRQLGPTKADAARLFGQQRAAPALGDKLANYYATQPFAVLQSVLDLMPQPTPTKPMSAEDAATMQALIMAQKAPEDTQLALRLALAGVDPLVLRQLGLLPDLGG